MLKLETTLGLLYRPACAANTARFITWGGSQSPEPYVKKVNEQECADAETTHIT